MIIRTLILLAIRDPHNEALTEAVGWNETFYAHEEHIGGKRWFLVDSYLNYGLPSQEWSDLLADGSIQAWH
jgi:hypothetical protein